MDVHKRMKPSSQFQWEKPYTSKIEALTRLVQLMKTEGDFTMLSIPWQKRNFIEWHQYKSLSYI